MLHAQIRSVAACTLLLSATLLAQDWPQWRGPNRDGTDPGFTAPQTWPQTLTQKWKIPVGAGDATPALVGNKLYVFSRRGGDEVTLCLDAATGKEIWKDTLAVPAITGPAARQHAGPRSSPAVADGKVVTLGVTGILSCLDAASGKVLWRNQEFKGVPKFYTSSSPLITDGLCIAQLGGPSDGVVAAFDLASGEIKWKWTSEGSSYASPVLLTADGTRQVVTFTDKSLIGLDLSDGKLLWQIPFVPQGMAYNAATPIVSGQTILYTGQGRGTHAVKIEKQDSTFTPKELWANPQVAVQFCSPVLKDGQLYLITDKGALTCLSAEDGKTLWTDPGKHGGYGAMIDAGRAIVALPEKSDLIVFKPDPKEFVQLADIKVADTPTYATPILTDKSIYIKDQDSLTLWSLE